MLISIIVPIYNCEKYLPRLLNSLINQTYKDIEIILINDGSTDDSLRICKEFQKKDSRIILYSKENGGVSSARNKGLDISKGEYVTFIDADDYVDEDFIRVLQSNISGNCLVKVFNKKFCKEKFTKGEFLKVLLTWKLTGGCWGYLFNKKIIGNIKFDINTSYMEDMVFVVEYLLNTQYVKLINVDMYHYKAKKESLTSSKNNIENKMEGYIYSIEKILNILEKNKLATSEIKESLENTKIDNIEAEFGMIENKEQIEEIIKNKKIMQSIKIKNIPLKYKPFFYILQTNNINLMFKYIKTRKFVKRIVKGELEE